MIGFVARVAESVDAVDLKSISSNGVRVQVPPRALFSHAWQKIMYQIEFDGNQEFFSL